MAKSKKKALEQLSLLLKKIDELENDNYFTSKYTKWKTKCTLFFKNYLQPDDQKDLQDHLFMPSGFYTSRQKNLQESHEEYLANKRIYLGKLRTMRSFLEAYYDDIKTNNLPKPEESAKKLNVLEKIVVIGIPMLIWIGLSNPLQLIFINSGKPVLQIFPVLLISVAGAIIVTALFKGKIYDLIFGPGFIIVYSIVKSVFDSIRQ